MPNLRNAGLMTSLMQTWDFSSRRLADTVGCSKSLVHNLSSGTRETTSEYVAVRLAKELRVPYSTLFVAPITSSNRGQDERLVNTKWVAERLDKPEAWVRDRATSGEFPYTRVGRQLRFKPSDIQTYVDASYQESA